MFKDNIFPPKPKKYNLQKLHPEVQSAMEQWMRNVEKKGITIKIVEGFRSIEEQNELYAQGRTKPGQKVTNAKGGQSYHNYGLAIDFAILDKEQLSWDIKKDGNENGVADWDEVVREAKKLGFSWGGDWKGFKDYPHLQMTFDQSIGELQEVWE
ncbi:M15 family metallopeptidase [Shimazuella kribbensis]|uniref:M15 family metallopeptidase n=1 Tax=Shimazuella kribbensis TaxID=139808 RepID=UPI003CCBF5B2